MIVAGQTVENPQTGERLVFHKTGAYRRRVHRVHRLHRARRAPADGPRPPRPERALRDHEGHAEPEDRGPHLEAKAGDVVTIEPGQAHYFANRTDEEVGFNVEVRPALKIESVIETMYGLAADGKTNRFGMPNPLRLAVIAEHHLDTVALPIVPVSLQRAALAVGAPIGRMLGYRATYTRKPVHLHGPGSPAGPRWPPPRTMKRALWIT